MANKLKPKVRDMDVEEHLLTTLYPRKAMVSKKITNASKNRVKSSWFGSR